MPGGEPTEIIAAIYDAAASDQPVSVAWDRMARLLETRVGGTWMLSMEDGTTGTARIAAAPSIAATFRRAYETVHAGNSPWVRALRVGSHPATVINAATGKDGADDASYRASPFYEEWMKPQRFRYTIASDVFHDGSDMLVLKTLLPPEIPPSDRIVALHDQLRPHIRRAAEIHRLDHARRAALQAAESVLDGLSVAVILARCRDSRITHMNKAAARLEAAEDGITTDDAGRLIAGDPGSTATLRRAIEACDTSIRTATDRPSIAMCLPRPSGAPDLHLLVTPAPEDTDMVLSQPTATVLITDPSHPPTLCLPHLIELHGLTTTEARVAAAWPVAPASRRPRMTLPSLTPRCAIT